MTARSLWSNAQLHGRLHANATSRFSCRECPQNHFSLSLSHSLSSPSSLVIFWAPHFSAPPSVIFHLLPPLPSPSLFLAVPSLPVPSFPGCRVSLPLIGEAFPTQVLVQLSSLLPSFLPLLSSSSSSASAASWTNRKNTRVKDTMREPGCARPAPPVSIPVTDRCVNLGKEVHSSLLRGQTWGRAGVGSSDESEEGKETEVINRMKEEEKKKPWVFFSLFFLKKKSATAGEIIHMSSSPIFSTPQ